MHEPLVHLRSMLATAALSGCLGATLPAAAQPFGEGVVCRLPPVACDFCPIPAAASVTEPASETAPSSVLNLPSLQPFAVSAGGLRVKPYGAFWADMIYNTQRTFTSAYTLFVFSEETQGEPVFTTDARRTRFGLLVDGPPIPQFGFTQSGGKVEIDFHGDFVTENRASVLLREAYWEARGARSRVLVGQTWDVISPIYPDTLSYAYGYLAGNIGFRRAQFRGERFVELSDTALWTFQGSLNQDIINDFATEPGIRRESSSWPVVEARTAISLGLRGSEPDVTTLGLSGHIGETGFDFLTAGPPPLNLPPEDDARFRTWSCNLDLHAPLGEKFGVRGELFVGENLSPYLGGVGQGVCPCLRAPIHSRGGWGQLWYRWTPRVRSHLGYGIDDPNGNDILYGISSNQFVFTNIVWDVDPRLTTGFEVSYFDTRYVETRTGQIPPEQLRPSTPGQAVTLNWMVKYAF